MQKFSGLLFILLIHAAFVAIPPEQAPQYKLKFENFFPSAEAEKADRKNLELALSSFQKLEGRLAKSPTDLEKGFQLYDQIQILLRKHSAYLYLRNAVNTKDETSLLESSSMEADVEKRTAFFRREVLQLDDQVLTQFRKERPSLKQYSFAIEELRRARPYTLTLKEEELLSATAPIHQDWQYDLYTKLLARTNFGSVQTTQGEMDVWKKRSDLASNPDRKVREEAFKKRFEGFTSQRDLYAFTLTQLARARSQIAKIRHYDDAATAAYFDRYWSKAEVTNLLERVAQEASLNKHYQEIRAQHARKITKVENVHVWDLSVRNPDFRVPQFTIQEATQIIRDALAPLGPEYAEELAALLKPENGRMDIVSGENRKSGGFSEGFIGTNSVFYSPGFNGSSNDLRVLAHESTHAIQRQLMTKNHVLPVYANGISYLFEATAIFNEFLLPDFLYNHEKDPLRKQFFLEQFLDTKGTVMFVAGPEALLEQEVYDGVEKNQIQGADDLDRLTQKIFSRFSIWFEKEEILKNQWMTIPLMYEDPFYDINYVYGSLIALKFYGLYNENPKEFATHYVAFLKNGFDAPPAALLKRFFGFDLNDPALVSDAMKIVRSRIDLLEKSYKEN